MLNYQRVNWWLAISPQKKHSDLNTQNTGFKHQDLGLQQEKKMGIDQPVGKTDPD